MLITFSGMVGSGKTTNAKKTLRLLRELGYQPHYLRFRFITWRSLLRSPAPKPWQPSPQKKRTVQTASAEPHPRALDAGRQLTLPVVFGFLVRILRFRLFIFLHHRRHLVVLNRYFYDSFAHFCAASSKEKKYLRLLLSLLPGPDLAFLLVLRPETAHRRRPAYSLDELQELSQNVHALQAVAGNLAVIATDDLSAVDRQVEERVKATVISKSKRRYEKASRS